MGAGGGGGRWRGRDVFRRQMVDLRGWTGVKSKNKPQEEHPPSSRRSQKSQESALWARDVRTRVSL